MLLLIADGVVCISGLASEKERISDVCIFGLANEEERISEEGKGCERH